LSPAPSVHGTVPFTRKIPGIRSKTHKRAKFRRWSLSFNCFSQLAVSKTLKRMRKNKNKYTDWKFIYFTPAAYATIGSGKNMLSSHWRAICVILYYYKTMKTKALFEWFRTTG